ncbi:transcriptional regulator, MerR family [Pseudopedobacter saltans DSM 12145]|uniref:S-adenosyl-L-methionine-dependent methyltransferase n=1 Tax=Pseudopedobacter saltans (strain ATCC 51119 / DSM 12145 / JCM 21818 / CCUG 39354 / LMG 10337 / NBRC 100064 / NCIMB 13643) TaxID=762903 RepID=F0S6L2_PSESL|nr:class I SAM-dependent methyltransferase [Pseudopedobacter saltans]ADY51088.1 transcriptional regulator, MerR family [Pseudopedobacter saltans DSM 12145]
MNEDLDTIPDNTAVRTALWRALHTMVDAKPHILEDIIGLQLVDPDSNWMQRPDMHPGFTKRIRASILARARFIEDLIMKAHHEGINQYVILGAGLDTFAQRRKDDISNLHIFEIDEPETQAWKQKRLIETGHSIPEWLHFVPVDFEKTSWKDELIKSGFDITEPAVIVSTGVTLYLTKDAIVSMLKQMSHFAKGSVLAVTLYLPIELMDKEDQPLQEIANKATKEAGTPFISFFSVKEMRDLANEAGFSDFELISTRDLESRYFGNRSDDFKPASGEVFLLVTL